MNVKKIAMIAVSIPIVLGLIGIGYTKYKRATNAAQGIYLPLKTEAEKSQYNLYFGNTHSHTNDGPDFGRGSSPEALAYARDVSKLDFMILTPHLFSVSDETLIAMQQAAAEATVASKFVAWSGQEADTSAVLLDTPAPHGVPGGAAELARDPFAPELDATMQMLAGLMSARFSGTAVYVGATERLPVVMGVWRDVYDWTNTQDEGFGIFFHPQEGDFGNFYSPDADNRWVSADVFINDDPFEPDYDYSAGYLWLLSQGWHVGASASYRNLAEWGAKNVRTGVWADDLTKASLTDAFQSRRTYATQAPNLSLMLRADGYTMGQEISARGATLNLSVEASDKNLKISTIDLYRGEYGSGKIAEIIATTEPELGEVNWVQTVPVSQDAQYYLTRIVMSNGAKAWSSPIWVNGM